MVPGTVTRNRRKEGRVAKQAIEEAGGAVAEARRLQLAQIETISIRVPLARTYKGSAYKMTHRSTLIVRLHTEAGIVGEAYVGDEDGALIEIERIVRDEIAPRILGEDLFA